MPFYFFIKTKILNWLCVGTCKFNFLSKQWTYGPKESRATLACLYTTSGRFYMLQLISVDSRFFTHPELSLRWSDLHEIKSVSLSISSSQ